METSYDEMNTIALGVDIGSDGLLFYPFGNGSERILSDKNPGASLLNLNFNIHKKQHLYRAGQEGVACAFRYGIDIMEYANVKPDVVRAANTGLFRSPVFREAIANLLGTKIELYETDGAVGAAQGAALGYGYFSSAREVFLDFKPILTGRPDEKKKERYVDLFGRWKESLM
jgi:xylulokinase